MDIVFCADRKVLPGLHVAAYSLLKRLDPEATKPRFHIFSCKLESKDLDLLRQTLSETGRPYLLESHWLATDRFLNCPRLNGSLTPYARLLVPKLLNVDRFLYVDVDTVCDVDVGKLRHLEMGTAPAGLVPEAPLESCADQEF